ncbi:ficolin-2-like isoform X2 [Rhopilema esculentum]|uniref:ficolin-2-like isoform X2 n=1 Tax=Rhopilema esculentum TaxID=499914 RepID=UPI0031DE804A
MKLNVFIRILIMWFCCRDTQGYILRLPCYSFGNFSIVRESFELFGRVVKTFEDLLVQECMFECVRHPHCRSITTTDSAGVNCKLHDKSAEDPGDNRIMSPSSNWTYRTTDPGEKNIGDLCRITQPCPVSMTCRATCACPGYKCHPRPDVIYSSCQDAYNRGMRESRAYPLYLQGLGAYRARCHMATLGRVWIVFQRRANDNVDFYRDWEEYKNGFGDPQGNYWLGLERLHHLARPGKGAILRVELRQWYFTSYASYSTFEIENEENQYRIRVSGYSGTAGDSLSQHNGVQFSTKDRDNDLASFHCAKTSSGAWWYSSCGVSNLNGVYSPKSRAVAEKMTWYATSSYSGIFFSEMKVGYL